MNAKKNNQLTVFMRNQLNQVKQKISVKAVDI